MKLWLDAQFSPDIATWIAEHFAIEAVPVRDVGLRDAADVEIFTAAKQARVVVFITLATAAQQAAGTDRYKAQTEAIIPLKLARRVSPELVSRRAQSTPGPAEALSRYSCAPAHQRFPSLCAVRC